MQDYLQKRALQGVRPRIERIVAQLRPGTCLETNICSKPTRTARELSQADARTDIFRFLLRTIRPKVVFVHSNDPIDYLERLVGCTGIADGEFKRVEWESHEFLLMGRKGPLFRLGFAEAEEIGRRIRQVIE